MAVKNCNACLDDIYMDIDFTCSKCKNVVCVRCINDNNICEKCASVKYTQTYVKCGICIDSVLQSMLFNCIFCGNARCYRCINKVVNKIEAYCKCCSVVCTKFSCNNITEYIHVRCGLCDDRFAYCSDHDYLIEHCSARSCTKRLCEQCTHNLVIRGMENGRFDAYCMHHEVKCLLCHNKTNINSWRKCNRCNTTICNQQCAIPHNRMLIFPRDSHDVCSMHLINTCDNPLHTTVPVKDMQCADENCDKYCCAKCALTVDISIDINTGAYIENKVLMCRTHRSKCNLCLRSIPKIQQVVTDLIGSYADEHILCKSCWTSLSEPMITLDLCLNRINKPIPIEIKCMIITHLYNIS